MPTFATILLAISIIALAAAILYSGLSIAKHFKCNQSAVSPSSLTPPDATRDQVLTIWMAAYTQSTALHNDIVKFLRTMSIGALGIGLTLVAQKTITITLDLSNYCKSDNAIVALAFLALSLLVTMGSLEVLTYQQRDLANHLRSKLNTDAQLSTILPDCKLPRKYYVFGVMSLLSLVIGSGLLALAISNTT